MAHILLVEDEDSIAVGLVDVLRVKGYQVDREADGVLGLERARGGDYDLLLLDVELPSLNGFEILKTLRAEGSEVRVVMLTARKTEMDRVLGFELGVDDYVTKPFSLLELLGRIQALLRRSPGLVEEAPRSSARLVFGPTTVELEKFSVTRGEQEMTLPARAFDILKALAQKRGEVVTRDQLMDDVWGPEEAITLRTLNNLIVKIRQAIEVRPDQPEYLKTVHGVGYRLDL